MKLINRKPATGRKEQALPLSPAELKLRFDSASLCPSIRVSSLEGWYSVTQRRLVEVCAHDAPFRGFLRRTDGGMVNGLASAYPEHQWQVWRFGKVPQGWWGSVDHRRAFLDHFSQSRHFKSLDDWYSIQVKDLLSLKGGAGLVSHFHNSLQKVLLSTYPNHPWDVSKFPSAGRGWYSKSLEHRKAFFEDFARRKNFTGLQDWYSVQLQDLPHKKGDWLSRGWQRTLVNTFPDHPWEPWRFKRKAHQYSTNSEDLRTQCDALAQILGITTSEAWYGVAFEKLARRKDTQGLELSQFHKSPYTTLQRAYPEHKFLPWRFKFVPKRFWTDGQSLAEFMAWFADKAGITTMDQWYTVSQSTFTKLGARRVLAQFSFSTVDLVLVAFPQHKWQVWRFSKCPKQFWKKDENIRAYLDWAAVDLGLADPGGRVDLARWYRIAPSELNSHFGQGLVLRFKGDLHKALAVAFPDHPWRGWLFVRPPKTFWRSKAAITGTINWFAEKKEFKIPERWYSVTPNQIRQAGAISLPSWFVVSKEVMRVFPNHKWQKKSFAKEKDSQLDLASVVTELYPLPGAESTK